MIRLIALFIMAGMAAAAGTRAVTTPTGAFTESFPGYAGPIHRVTLDDPQALWSRNLGAGIFNSVAVADSLFAFTGSGLNDPREAARYELSGIGEPAYAALGTEWEVAASQDGNYWAAVDRDADNNCILSLYSTTQDTPLWENHLGAGYVGGSRGLQFSRDGSTLVLFFGQLDNQPPWVYSWLVADMDSLPSMGYLVEAGQGISARALALSSDGAVIAATADNYLHILDGTTGVPRDIVEIGASTDGLALSADGNWALTGFQAVRCWRWNGTDYVQRWQSNLNQRYNSQLLISPDTTFAVSCWYTLQYNRTYIRVHNLSTGLALWNYNYRQDTGDFQDWPIDVDISEDSRWFAVGSWGDEGNTNGEVVVFSRYHARPYYELDLPGSCFSLDLSGNGKYLIAAGKHVHANQFGSGGDVTVVDLDPPPLAPIPQIPDSELIIDSLVTLCRDVFHLRIPVYNAGYAPMTVDSMALQSGFGAADQSVVVFDTAALHAEILPGDTLWVPVTFSPCAVGVTIGWYTHVFRFDVAGLSLGYGVIAQFVYPNASQEPPGLAAPDFVLNNPYPNPFNAQTGFTYSLPQASPVTLLIFDLQGREVHREDHALVTAGWHRQLFDASSLSSGVLFMRLESKFGSKTQKLMLLK